MTARQDSDVPRISLEVKRKPVIRVLDIITKKTGIKFFYNIEELKHLPRVTLQVQHETVDRVLELLLRGKGLYAVSTNGIIAIRPGNPPGSSVAPAQVSGIITDDKGKPLEQASIIEKGTNNGTTSGKDGHFTVSVSPGATLQISFIGMLPLQVPVSGHSLTITMRPAGNTINEVVVNGMSTVRQSYSAASVGSLAGADLDRADQLTADNMLQGRVTGLNVNFNSTTPGAAPKIRLRGTATLTGNREPIWVIDGIVTDPPVKLSALDINSLDNVNLLSTSIIGLNPRDIERIDVLKDAAATALYGVNGGNGVIVITTRKGRFNQPAQASFSQMTSILFRPGYRGLRRMSSADRVDLSKEAIDQGLVFFNDVLPDSFEKAYYSYLNGDIPEQEYRALEKHYKSLNTDWFDILFNNGVSQSYTVSVNGGSGKTAYYASGNYAGQKGPAVFTETRRYAGMLRMDREIGERLRISFKISGAQNTGLYPYRTDPYQYAYNTARSLPYMVDGKRFFYNASTFGGDWSINGYTRDKTRLSRTNIMQDMENSHKLTTINSGGAQASADWSFFRHFRFRGVYALSSSRARNESYAGESTHYIANRYRLDLAPAPDYDSTVRNTITLPYGGEYKEKVTRQYNYTLRNALEYARRLGAHYLQVLAGNELRQTRYDIHDLFLLGYYPDSGKKTFPPPAGEFPMYNYYMDYYNRTNPDDRQNWRYRQLSWYAMLVYSFKERYMMNLNIRQDNSNYFSQFNGDRLRPAWAAAFKWVITEEPWIKLNEKNMLALRLSYGFSNGLPDMTANTPQLTASRPQTDDLTGDQQSYITNFDNSTLRWEKIYTFNAGIDFSFFNSRLNGTLEAYRKQSNDLVATVNVEEENGIASSPLNKAGVLNYGAEAALQWQLLRNNLWSWEMGVNLSFNYSRTLQTSYTVPGETGSYEQYLDGNVIKTGTDPNMMYAFHFTGLDNKGRPTFRGIYDRDYSSRPTMAEYFENVFVPVGRRIPAADGGFFTSAGYRNWKLSAMFLVKLGYKQRLANLYGGFNFVPNPFENVSSDIKNRWKQPGDEKHTQLPALTDDAVSLVIDPYTMTPVQWDPSSGVNRASNPLYLQSTQPLEMYNYSDVNVVNAGHVRLSTLSLQYTFNADQASKLPFRYLSAYLQLHDLLLFYNKKLKGQDPELPAGAMPRRPSLTFGFDITF